jgi:hypothetical protein
MVMSRGASPWAFLSSPSASPLERASAVDALGGAGGGIDLSSAFSLGSGAADTGTGVGSSELGPPGMGDDDADMGNISPLLIAMAQQQMGAMDDSPTDEDRGLALAQAGFATAAGESDNPLQNFGTGAVSGIQALQQMRQQRAIQRMREGLAGQQTLLGAANLQQRMMSQKAQAESRRVDDERADRAYGLSEDRLEEEKRANRAREAAALAGRDAEIQQTDPIQLPDGDIVLPRFNKDAGEYEYKGDDGKWKPIPAGARKVPPSAGSPLGRTQFEKRENEFLTETEGLRKMDKYLGTVKTADQGFGLLADRFTSQIKTLFDSGELNEKEMATEAGRAKLQALLGANRVEVVGPGVMTEYDAARVLAALGGDVNSLRNPQVVKKVMKDMYDEKRRRASQFRDQLLFSAGTYGKKAEDYVIPDAMNFELSAPEGAMGDDDLINKYLNP